MRPTMELGKYVEDPGNCIDRISSLPDELLGHMLSFLPTRHAVSTSILSTRWRYLYTLTTILSFDDSPCFDDLEDYEIIEDNCEIIAATQRFKEFVDRVLEVHQVSRIKKFSLVCEGNYDNLDLDRWVSNALQKGVQELHINGIGCLPDEVFKCGTLVSLEIICSEYNRIQIPLSTLLPKLKILHLHRIMFFDFNSMERLLSSCELLEELTLKFWKCVSSSSISLVPDSYFMCETLVSLKLIGCGGNQIVTPLSASLPKLKILHLAHIIFYDFNSMERLFTSCGLLEELALIYCKCDTSGFAIHSTEILKVLTIKHCSFLLGTFEIDAPNLANLTYHSNIGVKIVPSWRNSCFFDKANLIFRYNFDEDFDIDMDLEDYDRELLKAAAYKANELHFEKDSVEILLKLDDDEQMPDFPSLSRLHLGDCPFDAWKYVTSLISKSPRLETVIFESGFCFCICSKHYCHDGCYCKSSSCSDILVVPFSCHVQVIEVHQFCGHECSLSLIGHLLTNAGHLKRLIIHMIYSRDWEENRVIIRDLLMLPRASRLCHVEIIFGPSRSRFVFKGNLEGKGAENLPCLEDLEGSEAER